MSSEGGDRALQDADAALARGDLDAAVAHLSTAVRELTSGEEPCRAAMACVRLGQIQANAMGNLTASRAWFARAQRLVEDVPDCLEQGWIAVAAMGCDVEDPAILLDAAELALDRARRFGDINLETKALADAGLAHVRAGRVADGMALLDEAMALACGPADDRDAAAKSVCSFFTACYHAGDFERADAWTSMLRDQGLISLEFGSPVFLSNHCDSVQATLLVELGRWSEAEVVLSRAKAEFESVMPRSSWHPDLALADLRVRQGRLAEAEELVLGKDQSVEALLPAARLHLAARDHDLARAAISRGMRAIGDDRLRVVQLLTVLVDVELDRGDVDAALVVAAQLDEWARGVDVAALEARAALARACALDRAGSSAEAIALLERSLDRIDATQLPWLRSSLLLALARLREASGDVAGATLDAESAASILAGLDVVTPPDDGALLQRLCRGRPQNVSVAVLARNGKWWSAACDGVEARLSDTKGLRYLAELVARPGHERHALDLVDAIEGTDESGGVARRSLGDAGDVLDPHARVAYRHRIEELRAEADDALAAGMLETAERKEAEIDALVQQLAAAFGLGGRSRQAASAVERARLNVTRALRSAVARVGEALPGPAKVLDRRLRTGTFCAYEPDVTDEVTWIARS